MRRWLEAVRASIWAGLLARAGAAALGVVLLAWVGTSFGAASPNASAASPASPPSPPVASLTAPAAAAPAPSAPAASAPAASAAVTQPPSPAASGSTVPRRATAEAPVILNTAGAEELRRLPGVGDKRADAILALRKRLGRFSRIEDLLRVKGVGRATLKKWRPLVRLDPPPEGAPDQASAERMPATSGPMASARSL